MDTMRFGKQPHGTSAAMPKDVTESNIQQHAGGENVDVGNSGHGNGLASEQEQEYVHHVRTE